MMKWADSITWLLVFAGWLVVHKATLSRDRRKEKREVCLALCTDLLELQGHAIDFHTAPNFEPRKSMEVAQQVERIVLRLQRGPLKELAVPLPTIVSLRQRITGHNMDKSDFSQQQTDSEVVLEIRNAVGDLIIAIEDARDQTWE